MPEGAPQPGEVYRHYKGNDYKIVGIAMGSDEQLTVVYEPMYECEYNLFTRPLREWGEEVEWDGKKLKRFEKVSH